MPKLPREDSNMYGQYENSDKLLLRAAYYAVHASWCLPHRFEQGQQDGQALLELSIETDRLMFGVGFDLVADTLQSQRVWLQNLSKDEKLQLARLLNEYVTISSQCSHSACEVCWSVEDCVCGCHLEANRGNKQTGDAEVS